MLVATIRGKVSGSIVMINPPKVLEYIKILRDIFFVFVLLKLAHLFAVLGIGFPADYRNSVDLLYAAAVSAFALVMLATRHKKAGQYRKIASAFLYTGLLLVAPFALIQNLFHTNDVGSLLITMQENQGSNLIRIGISSFAPEIATVFVGVSLISVIIQHLRKHYYIFDIVALAFGISLLVFGPLSVYLWHLVFPSKFHGLIIPESMVIEPNFLSEPEQPKNLIIVYLESIERTYRDIEFTKSAFKSLGYIEDLGFSARNVQQVLGTNNTVAGLVASQCGVPLLPRGAIDVGTNNLQNRGSAADFSDFMSGQTCLGDVLTKRGYVASYLNGASLDVFAKRDFFHTHGYTRLVGFDELKEQLSTEQILLWGASDDVIFSKAKDEIHFLASQDRPFLFSMLTIATHGPEAFLDPTCHPESSEPEMVAAIRCTGQYVVDLRNYIESEELLKDTIFIVLSDHLAMSNTIYGYLTEIEPERRNLFAASGDPEISMKASSTLDVYPTILELIGFQLEGGKAGLGVSLLNANPTLTEEIGAETLSKAISGNSQLQRYLWGGSVSQIP